MLADAAANLWQCIRQPSQPAGFAQLAPDKIGQHGQLQEWQDDVDQPDNNHRHMSPLWGLYPGAQFTTTSDEKLYKAAKLLLKLFRYLTSRKAPPEIFRSLLRGQVHTLGVGMHNFMDAKQVAQAHTDPTVRARLDACVFKGAVKRNGEWVAVPMCSMNQQTWSEVYDSRLNDPELLKEPQVFSKEDQTEPVGI